ncbi:uncharacterized protein LOC124924786 [Impatiens glandulifera]|uniref:uncharacterized protein LOC124924786 n=1 Tax=Impatiens glandulifera TaxID=253017 RepID=UPI001FB0BCC7|nr:uncharacterized protein LOC124924786 [Impatiens glandulifera]
MAPSSPFRMRTRQHARSISFPSRTYPLLPQLDEQLNRLKETGAASTSLSSLGDRLSGLQDLHLSVDDLLDMPHIQHSLTTVHESNKKLADDVLDKYIKVLDACTATKGIFSQAKFDVQELLSSLRRRKDATDASGKYLASRRKDKKAIQMALKDLKNVKISEGNDQLDAIDLFNSVQSATVSVLESSLTYVMGTKARSSLISKLIHTECKGANKNEFDQINEALGVMDIESIQRQLEEMELKIQDIEEGLDCLFKHLIKTRVLLLNMLSY